MNICIHCTVDRHYQQDTCCRCNCCRYIETFKVDLNYSSSVQFSSVQFSSVGVLVCWCVGVLVCWCVGVLVCWCVGVLVCWCVGVCWGVHVCVVQIIKIIKNYTYTHIYLQLYILLHILIYIYIYITIIQFFINKKLFNFSQFYYVKLMSECHFK